jgi:nicotinate-nucleotide--dimethylbenzimidazole phosphoribosyltransferase
MNPWYQQPPAAIDLQSAIMTAAHAHQAQLTKPPGALGRLESIALRFAAWQQTVHPQLERIRIVVFAADHGIAVQESVSAFPSVVTAQMVTNMAQGGAAISVLARELAAELELIVLGTVAPVASAPTILIDWIAPSTASFVTQPAMTDAQCQQALQAGRLAAQRAQTAGTQLFIGGEMGIGNTTAATALACAILQKPALELAGPGTGISASRMAHKIALIEQALAYHHAQLVQPLTILTCLGGFEIAALVGCYIACAQQGIPILVDGFISSAAALIAMRLCPGVEQWMLLAHASAEPGHRLIIEALGLQPLIDFGLRLGEGSGAAVTVPLLRLACALHNQMATFSQAGVATQ